MKNSCCKVAFIVVLNTKKPNFKKFEKWIAIKPNNIRHFCPTGDTIKVWANKG